MRYSFYFAIAFIFFLSESCKKTPYVFDPCSVYTPFNGALTVQQEVADTVFTADTVFSHCYLHFVPSGIGLDSSYWEIDYFNPFKTKGEGRKYLNVSADVPMNVKLTSYRRPSSIICPSKDTAAYYFSKKLYVVDMSESIIKGDFRGVNSDNLTDTFTVSIRYVPDPFPQYFLSNLPRGCTRSRPDYPPNIGYTITAGYKVFHFDGNTCLPNVHGNGFIEGKDSLVIHYYSVMDDSGAKVYQTFRAKRV